MSSRKNRLLLMAILFPFTICTFYWVMQVAQNVARFDLWLLHRDHRCSHSVLDYSNMWNAVALINVRPRRMLPTQSKRMTEY